MNVDAPKVGQNPDNSSAHIHVTARTVKRMLDLLPVERAVAISVVTLEGMREDGKLPLGRLGTLLNNCSRVDAQKPRRQGREGHIECEAALTQGRAPAEPRERHRDGCLGAWMDLM